MEQQQPQSQASRPTPKQTTPNPKVNPPTNLTLKGNRKAWHHLFKSDIKPLMKNISFKKGAPRIERIDHGHIFHSVNSQMKPQEFSSTVGGHFHKIEWVTGPDGKPMVKSVSGPLHYIYRKSPHGQKRKMVPVEFLDQTGEEEKMIKDAHTHVFGYIHSEELQEKALRNVQAPTLEAGMADAGLEDVSGD
jgi:hypothetical protein